MLVPIHHRTTYLVMTVTFCLHVMRRSHHHIIYFEVTATSGFSEVRPEYQHVTISSRANVSIGLNVVRLQDHFITYLRNDGSHFISNKWVQ